MRVEKTASSSGTTKYIGKLYECKVGGTCIKYIFAGGQHIANIVGDKCAVLSRRSSRQYQRDYRRSGRKPGGDILLSLWLNNDRRRPHKPQVYLARV